MCTVNKAMSNDLNLGFLNILNFQSTRSYIFSELEFSLFCRSLPSNLIVVSSTFNRYGENARNTSAMFKDNPLPPLENAVYWIEYVCRYGGTAHLRTAANDLYWFQYLLLDVLLLVLCVTLVSLWATKKILVLTVNRWCCRGARQKVSIEKKKQ